MDTKKKLSKHTTLPKNVEPSHLFQVNTITTMKRATITVFVVTPYYLNQAQSLTLGVVGQVSMKLLIVIVFVR